MEKLGPEDVRLFIELFRARDPARLAESVGRRRVERLLRMLGLTGDRLEKALAEGSDIVEALFQPSRVAVAWSPLELVWASKPTPMVRLRLGGLPVLWAKLEWFNPYSLSVKDRPAARLFQQALQSGARGVVEASSGNTGVALAALAAALGLRAVILLPRNPPEATLKVLELLGAEVQVGEESLTVEMIERARRIAEAEGLLHTDQFGNDANFLSHLSTTAPEMLYQLGAAGVEPDFVVAGSGTSGTSAALLLAAHAYYRGRPKLYVVHPARGDRIEGLRRLETGARWLEMLREAGVRYGLVEVSRRDALCAARRVARETGLTVGPSSGAVVAGVQRLVEEGELSGGMVGATLFPDSALRYLDALTRLDC